MFAHRSMSLLFRTPLTRTPSAGKIAYLELQTLPSRPRALSRGISSSINVNTSALPHARPITRTRTSSLTFHRSASSDGKDNMELYSDEAGSTNAGTSDVAATDAAFDKDANPESTAKKIEGETGKDFTQRSPANEGYSEPHEEGKKGNGDPKAGGPPMDTGKGDKYSK